MCVKNKSLKFIKTWSERVNQLKHYQLIIYLKWKTLSNQIVDGVPVIVKFWSSTQYQFWFWIPVFQFWPMWACQKTFKTFKNCKENFLLQWLNISELFQVQDKGCKRSSGNEKDQEGERSQPRSSLHWCFSYFLCRFCSTGVYYGYTSSFLLSHQ